MSSIIVNALYKPHLNLTVAPLKLLILVVIYSNFQVQEITLKNYISIFIIETVSRYSPKSLCKYQNK